MGALLIVAIAGLTTWALWPSRPYPNELTGHAARGDIAAVRACLRRGADPNAPERWGWQHENLGQTPLTVAAQHGRVEVVRLLLQHGADPNLRDGDPDFPHETPLTTAVIHGQLEVCRVLLETGADPNLPTNPDGTGDNWTALDWALHEPPQPAIAELLRQHGAVPRQQRRAE